MDILEQLRISALLKAPFHHSKLSWRIGKKSNWDYKLNKPKDPNKPVKALMLVYIDARDVQDRLDKVCCLDWSNEFKEVMGRMVCYLTIAGVTRVDGAGDTEFEAEKGGLSDSFKRAAVMFGVGRYLYNAKNCNTWIEYEQGDNDFNIAEKAKKQFAAIAVKLGESVQSWEYWLNQIIYCQNEKDLDYLLDEVREYAKEENWSQEVMQKIAEEAKEKRESIKGVK